MFLFMMNMFGQFEISVPHKLVNLALFKGNDNAVIKDFFNGFFATLMATPCSAPPANSAPRRARRPWRRDAGAARRRRPGLPGEGARARAEKTPCGDLVAALVAELMRHRDSLASRRAQTHRRGRPAGLGHA